MKFAITHIVNEKPKKEFYLQVPFVTLELSNHTYQLGFDLNESLTQDELINGLKNNQLIKTVSQDIKDDKRVWKSPKGKFFIGNKNVPTEKEKITLDLGYSDFIKEQNYGEYFSEFMDSVAIGANDLNNKDLPKTIIDSVRKLYTSWCENAKADAMIRTSNYEVISDKGYYSDVNALSKEYADYVRANLLEDMYADKGELFKKSRDKGEKDLIEFFDNDRLKDFPFLILMPFFLIPKRKNHFGIIPYGKQTKIGVVFPSNWVGLTNLRKKDGIREKRDNIEDPISFNVKESNEILIELISSLNELGGASIKNFEGYVFDEVLKTIAKKSFDKADSLLLNLYDHQIQIKASEMIPSVIKEKLKDVIVFDLASKFIRQRIGDSRQDYIALSLEHGLNIEVGIGYSLKMLPRIIQESNWKLFLKTFYEFLNESEDENLEDLMDNGIKLYSVPKYLQTEDVNS